MLKRDYIKYLLYREFMVGVNKLKEFKNLLSEFLVKTKPFVWVIILKSIIKGGTTLNTSFAIKQWAIFYFGGDKMNTLEIGKLYRHFKGNYYLVLGTAFNSETKERYVIYKALYGEYKTWIRPEKMFLEEIDYDRKDNITKQKYRFERIDL